ncbi:hypothetical protein [Pedobacter rhodius]|uniref:Uncharacterized protein n=1 Tax=Pedobacter rhodius TaxID=3004098 RepID=A0ABT4KVP1_9SPHI|nr:hypothetical protein [Pedobacter sp. SJ11]MCZ4222994.1 hypothetical protein [Pedobacter sp. SJ11]
MHTNLIFLSYGGVIEYRRAIFCILSFLAWNPKIENIRVIVFTDSPDFFKKYLLNLNIEYVLLNSELEEKLMRGSDFIHSKKVGVIDMAFKSYPNTNQLFIDTDTFFLTDASIMLNGFEEGKSFMHKREYMLKEGVDLFSSFDQGHYPKAFLNYISGRVFKINGIAESFNGEDYSWNSGVLALHKTFSVYMNDVIKLTHKFYNNSKWFISEQLAFSLILQRKTKVRSAEKYIFHYWAKRQKMFMDNFLQNLFDQKLVSELNDQALNRRLTKKLETDIEIDLSIEQINIAFSRKDYFYAFKKGIRLILKKTFLFELI